MNKNYNINFSFELVRFCKLILFLFLSIVLLLIIPTCIDIPKLVFETLVDDIVLLFMFFLLYPSLDNSYSLLKENFIKSTSVLAILLPIFIAIIKGFVLSFTRFIPLFFDANVIGIGSSQAIIQLPPFSLSYFFVYCLSPGVTEEIVFRFIPYIFPKIIIENLNILKAILPNKFILNPINKFYKDLYINKKTWAMISWLIITSTIFSLAHGPNITNFYLYFVPGAIFGCLYLKYGLISCMLCHMFGNYFSPFILQIVIYIFTNYFVI